MATNKHMARVVIANRVGLSGVIEILKEVAELSDKDLLSAYDEAVARKRAMINANREALTAQEAELE